MRNRHRSGIPGLLALLVLVAPPFPVAARAQAAQEASMVKAVRVAGTVRDLQNAITLPGATVEVVGGTTMVLTDTDGRYVMDLAPGSYELRVVMSGYQDRKVKVEVRASETPKVDIGLAMKSFADEVTVEANTNAVSSSAEAQLSARKGASVITDNMGSDDMKANGDADAASALARVTGLSIVDSQYVFVRGLGERYSNTTLAGSVIPTTEPDKKVVPLDLFPSGLIDSVQVAKTYSPDQSAEFAGGLVQVVPMKFPSRRVFDISIGGQHSSTATGKSIPLSPLGNRDYFGFDNGARALPSSIPANKIVRQGVYSPAVGFVRDDITAAGRSLDNRWSPARKDGRPGQSFSAVFGDRFGKLGVVASVSQSYKEILRAGGPPLLPHRRGQRTRGGERLRHGNRDPEGPDRRRVEPRLPVLAQLTGCRWRISTPTPDVTKGRLFQGPNTENNFIYRNERLQYIEEELLSTGLTGEHFLTGLSNSRFDWRVNYARATRDEPDLRETLYQQNINGTGAFLLADESQSGFRMFNGLEDDTLDVAANWSLLKAVSGRSAQFKVGANYVQRTRDFSSRRFRFIPNSANTGGSVGINLAQTPETLFASSNIGSIFRFNEETRPVDAYDGETKTMAGYGMVDIALSDKARIVGGARVENYDQQVNTFDPFGLFLGKVSAQIKNTDIYPGANFIYTVRNDTNFRVSYSRTVNRPEFRELAAFEFTDVVGSRAVRGNPELTRALIQNVDARLERLSGGRDVLAISGFFKDFDAPIERVVIAGAQPIVTFQNAQSARNLGLELEAARQFGSNFFVNLNYTFVDSTITLAPAQRTVQTSLERPLAGQSKNLFNAMAELSVSGVSARVLYNYFGDRISDVGSNEAPDIIEQGRGSLDVVLAKRFGKLGLRLTLENLTDTEHLFTQGSKEQRAYKLGRVTAFSLSFNAF
jgi:outer membrane receptor protein involved in Fe transport